MLHSICWYLFTDRTAYHSLNINKHLSTYAVSRPRSGKTSTTPQHEPVISHGLNMFNNTMSLFNLCSFLTPVVPFIFHFQKFLCCALHKAAHNLLTDHTIMKVKLTIYHPLRSIFHSPGNKMPTPLNQDSHFLKVSSDTQYVYILLVKHFWLNFLNM
jgi:hypothetical protein